MHLTFLTPTLEAAGGTVVLHHYVEASLAAGHQVTLVSPARGKWPTHHERLAIATYPAVKVRYSDTLSFQAPYWKAILHNIPTDTDWLIPIYTPLLVPAIRFRQQHPGVGILLLAQESMEIPIIGPYNRWLLGRRRVHQAVAGIVAVSEKLAEQVSQLVPKSTPVRTILNGIDHSIFRPQPEISKKEEILFVGRPDVTKGYPVFLEALELLQAEFPNLRGRVAAAEQYTIKHPLVVHSPSTQAELATWYAQASVYVSLSLAESFGFPPLEAMACRTPVVTTRNTGTSQYIEDGRNCLVVPVKNAPATAAAIARILKDASLAQKLIAAAEKTAARFDWTTAAPTFLTFLADLDQNR